MKLVIFDTETTGLPKSREAVEKKAQQLATFGVYFLGCS